MNDCPQGILLTIISARYRADKTWSCLSFAPLRLCVSFFCLSLLRVGRELRDGENRCDRGGLFLELLIKALQ